MNKIETWRPPPAKPELPKQGDLHLWLIDLDIGPAHFELYLDNEERNRAGRMLDAAGSRRFVTARGCLRKIVGDYLTFDARSIAFRYGIIGKPEIAHPSSGLRFNLSHSGHLALLALTWQSDIGVDIEPLKPRSNMLPIVRKILGVNSYEALATMPEPERTVRFIEWWTTLEARAKCDGKGVFSQIDNRRPAVNFEPESGWIAAVAIANGIPAISQWVTHRVAEHVLWR